MGDMLVEQIKSGPFHETDPEKADYFWIPGGGMYTARGNMTRRQFIISIFMHVRSHHPWWNRTLALGQARWVCHQGHQYMAPEDARGHHEFSYMLRHVFVALFDGGLGEAFEGVGWGENPEYIPPGQMRIYGLTTFLPRFPPYPSPSLSPFLSA